jgi:hypothetical protein
VPDRGRTQAQVRAGCGEGDGPDEREPPVSERKGEERSWRASVLGREELGRAWKKKEKASGLLGCTVKKGKKKKLGQLGWAARGKRERKTQKREWAWPN